MNNKAISIVWLRRDLRLHDHAALAGALEADGEIQPIFVFDTDVLERFSHKQDRRLSFIARTLAHLHEQLKAKEGGLLVLHGSAKQIVPKLSRELEAQQVVAAEDYEPSAIVRDDAVQEELEGRLKLVKDQLIFAPDEVLKDDGNPYKVYTPYSKLWLDKLTPSDYGACEVKDKSRYAHFPTSVKMAKDAGLTVVDANASVESMLETVGYEEVRDDYWTVDDAQKRLKQWARNKIEDYADTRDALADKGTSEISPYLRFGLVSVRECMRAAKEAGHANNKGISTWIKELVWREFYATILYHYPESTKKEWNEKYRDLKWQGKDAHFEAWKKGETGYPVVDAAMRQLRELGWMHNRARMIVASFLTKDLHVDWRKGEEHFSQHLMDYEQASNVGGWQWAASTGTDAQPYFRIFNPITQSKKFDPEGEYIRRYVPELKAFEGKEIHEPWKKSLFDDSGYPQRIVDHSKAREVALKMFKDVG